LFVALYAKILFLLSASFMATIETQKPKLVHPDRLGYSWENAGKVLQGLDKMNGRQVESLSKKLGLPESFVLRNAILLPEISSISTKHNTAPQTFDEMTPVLEPAQPTEFYRYLIEAEPIRSSKYSVHKGWDLKLCRQVAVKIPSSGLGWWGTLDSDNQILELEARVDDRFSPAQSLPVYDLIYTYHPKNPQNIFLALVFPYEDPNISPDLDRRISSEVGLTTEDILSITLQLAFIIDSLDGHGVLHRDLKPGNVILNNGQRVRLIDFEISNIRCRQFPPRKENFLKTVGYASPEVAEKTSEDVRSEVFNLAQIVYEMFTREMFLREIDVKELAREAWCTDGLRSFHVEKLYELYPLGIVDRVIPVLNKALAHKKRNRYSTAMEFAFGLIQAVDPNHSLLKSISARNSLAKKVNRAS